MASVEALGVAASRLSLTVFEALYERRRTVVVFGVVLYLARRYLHRNRKLPPGPWAWPLLGHLHLLMAKDKRPVFKKLRETYGNLVYLCVGRQPIIVVSGYEAINEVLSRRARDFEWRAQVFTTLKIGQGKGVVNASGEAWREHRMFLFNTMKSLGIGKTSFEDNIIDEIELIMPILKSKAGQDFDCQTLLQTASCNIICVIAFGKWFSYEDEDLHRLLDLIDANMRIVGGTAIVNYFPFLEWAPFDLFKCRRALNTVAQVQSVIKVWVDQHVQELNPDDPRDIIDLYLTSMNQKIAKGEKTTFNEAQLIKFIGDLFVGGQETTVTTLMWSLILLVRHPDVQDKLHHEITTRLNESVSGHLSMDDRVHMPYTVATIAECQRIADIAPFCIPHSNPEPVELHGYTIPKGSLVIPVLNSLHHDEREWENPMEMRPERFYDGTTDKCNISQKKMLPFSAGTRACPGKSLAVMELFFFITSIVQHFKILPPESGHIPSLEGHIGVTYVPDCCTLRFISRTEMSDTKIISSSSSESESIGPTINDNDTSLSVKEMKSR